MKHHYYLEKMGWEPHKVPHDKEKRKYGFNINEIWNLDIESIFWLYEHLMRYFDTAKDIVDLNFRKVRIPVLTETEQTADEWFHKVKEASISTYSNVTGKYEVTFVEMTQEQAIGICLKYLADFVHHTCNEDEYDYESHNDEENKIHILEDAYKDACVYEKASTALKIYSELLPMMWI